MFLNSVTEDNFNRDVVSCVLDSDNVAEGSGDEETDAMDVSPEGSAGCLQALACPLICKTEVLVATRHPAMNSSLSQEIL